MMRSALRDELLVGRGVQELADLAGVGKAELDHPALAEGIAVDELGIPAQLAVDLDDLATDRREEVADGLDRLDDAERRELVDGPADGRQVDEHDVAELVRREVGHADGRLVTFDPDPLVVLRIPQVPWDHPASSSWARPADRAPASCCQPARGLGLPPRSSACRA